MDKKELTKILKPLIKECVKEVIMEEPGVLAHVIKESVQGISVSTITERKDEEPIRKFMKKTQASKRSQWPAVTGAAKKPSVTSISW